MDDLSNFYNGNHLQAVRDQSTQHGDKDFQEEQAELELVMEATSFQDYTYDAQGSLTADANLGITAVTYNHLGLTETVTLTGGRQLRYLYAADGTRLARVRLQPGHAALRDDLMGAFAYQDGVLNHILHGEGRIVPAVLPGRQYRHEYHYRDQLGNLRLAFSDLDFDGVAEVGDILQEAHYYPYGLGFSGMSTVANGVPSRYSFNGKEAQEAFGMGWIDFGARMYNAQLGRWMAVDPLADQRLAYSPYAFVSNDPISRVDPDGRLDGDYFDLHGNFLGTDGIQDGKVFILKDGIRAKLENCKVNWQGLLNSPYLEEIQKASNEVPMDSDLGLMIRTVYAEMRGGDDNAKAIVAESIQNRFELSAGYEKADGTYKGIVERFYDVSKSTHAANDAFANPTNHIYKNPEATESWISSVSASIKAKAGESNVGKGVIFYNSSSPTYYDNNSKMEKIALDITPNGIQGLWKLK